MGSVTLRNDHKGISEQRVSAHLLFFKLTFGLDFQFGLGLTLGLDLEFGLGLRLAV